jgi:hypothetical protein
VAKLVFKHACKVKLPRIYCYNIISFVGKNNYFTHQKAMGKVLTFFILLFGTMQLTAQTISGHVYDEKRQPLEGASVYLDGTTISTSTDSKGYFALEADPNIPATMVVNFMGYKPVKIEKPFTGILLEIVLTADVIEMDAAVVAVSAVFSRKEMLRAFRQQFLGKSKAGSSCEIENEDDIYLRYDTSSNILYAEAAQPLRIRNKRLKYIVTFDLIASEIRYNNKTLNPDYMTGAFFGGTTFFTDVSTNGDADKQRKEAYLGSPTHFVKTAIEGDWDGQKFQLFQRSRLIKPNEYFTVKDTLGIKKVTILAHPVNQTVTLSSEKGKKTDQGIKRQRFEVLYRKRINSFLLYDTGSFYANSNGIFWPLYELTFGGYMGNLRVGDMLPANYTAAEE